MCANLGRCGQRGPRTSDNRRVMEQERVEPVELEVRECSEGYELALKGQPLSTVIGGHPVRHEAAPLLAHMIEEYVKFPEIKVVGGRITDPQFIGAYMLLGLQREFIDARADNLTQNFPFELLRDPILTRLAGPEQRDLAARHDAVREWLTSEGLRLVDVDFVDLETIDIPEDYMRTNPTLGGEDTEAFHRLADELRRMFDALTPEERAGVVFLHNAHDGSLVHGMALMLDKCSARGYAAGVGAAHLVLAGFVDVTDEAHSGAYAELQSDALATLDYVAAYRQGTVAGRLRELLLEGAENTEVEFKSTLRFDLKLQTNNREVTESVLKTVAAFLNTRGGTLLIGVADDRSVVGIEHDNFASDDEFLRHLYTMLGNAMGEAVAPLVQSSIVGTPAGRHVCLVDCARSPVPVMCTFKKSPEAFFVRTGPATVNLVGEERDRFQQLHWGPND